MSTAKETFHYLRDDAKMVGIDVGFDAIRFVVLRTYRDHYSLQYAVVNESLYSHNLHEKNTALRETLSTTARYLGIERNTPVYLSFSQGTDIADDAQLKKIMDNFNNHLITIPFEIKSHLTSSRYETVHVTALKEYVTDVISLLKSCHIPVSAVSFLPFSLVHASSAPLSDDDWYETNGVIHVGPHESYCCIRAGYYVFGLKRFPVGSASMQKCEKPDEHGDSRKHLAEIVAHCFSEMKEYIGLIARDKNVVPKKMVLSGALPDIEKTARALSQVFHIPIMPWGIRGALDVAHDITGQKQFLADEPSLAIAMSMLSREVILFEPSYYTQPIIIESFKDFNRRFRITG